MLESEVTEKDIEDTKKALGKIHLNQSEHKRLERSEVDQKARDMLTNKLTARPFFRRCKFQHLEMMQSALTEALEAKRIEEQERLAHLQAKQDVLEKINALMSSEQIDLDDLQEFNKTRRKRKTIEINSDGEEKLVTTSKPNIIKYKCHIFDRDYYWHGKGIMPKPFRCHLAKGHTEESIRIDAADFFILTCKLYQTIDKEYSVQADALLADFERQKLPKYLKHPDKVRHFENLLVRDSL